MEKIGPPAARSTRARDAEAPPGSQRARAGTLELVVAHPSALLAPRADTERPMRGESQVASAMKYRRPVRLETSPAASLSLRAGRRAASPSCNESRRRLRGAQGAPRPSLPLEPLPRPSAPPRLDSNAALQSLHRRLARAMTLCESYVPSLRYGLRDGSCGRAGDGVTAPVTDLARDASGWCSLGCRPRIALRA